jgi:hypothetical protein
LRLGTLVGELKTVYSMIQWDKMIMEYTYEGLNHRPKIVLNYSHQVWCYDTSKANKYNGVLISPYQEGNKH